MDFLDFVAAVMIANVLTVVFVFSCVRSAKFAEAETPWLTLAGIALPLGFVLISLFQSVGTPTAFDALTTTEGPTTEISDTEFLESVGLN